MTYLRMTESLEICARTPCVPNPAFLAMVHLHRGSVLSRSSRYTLFEASYAGRRGRHLSNRDQLGDINRPHDIDILGQSLEESRELWD